MRYISRQVVKFQVTGWIAPGRVASGRVAAWLIVRGVRDMNVGAGQELFAAWRHHAVFTGSPFEMVQAATSSASLPGPPATATVTSPCACVAAGTARPSG